MASVLGGVYIYLSKPLKEMSICPQIGKCCFFSKTEYTKYITDCWMLFCSCSELTLRVYDVIIICY